MYYLQLLGKELCMPRRIAAWGRFIGTLLASMLLVSLLGTHPAHAATTITVTSPGGTVQGAFSVDNSGTLHYRVSRGSVPVIEPSPLGITLDGVALGSGVTLGTPTTTTVDETYPTRGVHPVAVNHYTLTSIPVTHAGSGITYTLEVRAYDDGLAYRYNIPVGGAHTVTSEQSSWTIPDGTTVWIFENASDAKLKTYSGSMTPVNVNDLPTVSPQGPVQGAGLTLVLPNGGGYAVLSEAALANYSGMRLEAIGNRTVRVNFTEGASGFGVSGPVTTPWRFTLTTPDLNGLVNSDLVTNLNPAPDPALYGDTSWIKPGRSLWSWLSAPNHAITIDQERAYINAAAQLGFEYTTIDNGWETAFAQNGATAWDTLKALCDDARSKGVGVFVWKNSNAVSNPSNNWQDLRAFLDQVQHAGAAGVKMDYFYAESKSKIDFEVAILRETAARHLLVNFHGISKPTGEQRTFPNQLTREAVRGLEVGLPGARHDAALPFTRFVLGPADYTPLAFTNNYAEQLATLVIYTSPLQVISASAQKLLNDSSLAPALDVVKAVPTVWDETRVLPPSQIGQLALFARRAGDRWFVAGINGDKNSSRSLPLDLSFLGTRRYDAVLLTSGANDGSLVRQDLANVGADTLVNVDMLKAGGFVMMLTPQPDPTPASTTTILAVSPNPATTGDMVTLVATVSAATGMPTGNVQFHDGDSVLGTAVIDAQGGAVLTTAALTTGSHTLTASYAGDSSFAASTSAAAVEQIVPVPDPTLTSTTTSLVVSPNPATTGDMVTLVATVSAATGMPTGNVQFRDVDNVLGTAPLDGQGRAVLTTTALPPGSHTLTASYAGDSSFAASTSAAVVEQIVSAAAEQRQIFMPMIAQP
jgi:alpha-glucosidase